MTKTHGNTHGGDKWGNATLKNELKSLRYVGVMLVLQCTRRDASKKLKIHGHKIAQFTTQTGAKQPNFSRVSSAMISYLSSS